MSLCINPQCPKSQNSDRLLFCPACGSELLLQGRYRVITIMGEGGFAKTYEVMDTRSNLPKVLKMLVKNDSPKAVELFQREAEVLSNLNHPGIPRVESDASFLYYPRNSQQPFHCLVMEKIEGLDLYQYFQRRGDRPIDQQLAIAWLKELTIILQQVHSQNFFHRDIKPSNIMLRANGALALIDFGTARRITGSYTMKQSSGQITGVISAGYTPPEQFNGQAVRQSDFFALGRTMVYLLTGHEPSELYDPQTDELHWRDRATGISHFLANFLDYMMAPLPKDRPQNAEEILHYLGEVEAHLFTPPPLPPASNESVTFPTDEELPDTVIGQKQENNPTLAPANSPNKNILFAALAGGLSLFGALLFLLFTVALPKFTFQANMTKQQDAKSYIRTVNKAQQNFYLKNKDFAASVAELNLEVNLNPQNYSDTLEEIKTGVVQVAAISKINGLKSYTGIVFTQQDISGSTITKAIVCESDRDDQVVPTEPRIIGKQIQCPSGFSLLSN